MEAGARHLPGLDLCLEVQIPVRITAPTGPDGSRSSGQVELGEGILHLLVDTRPHTIEDVLVQHDVAGYHRVAWKIENTSPGWYGHLSGWTHGLDPVSPEHYGPAALRRRSGAVHHADAHQGNHVLVDRDEGLHTGRERALTRQRSGREAPKPDKEKCCPRDAPHRVAPLLGLRTTARG